MRTLELRRHAQRDPAADRLSKQGRAQAQSVGTTLAGGYSAVFVSPAQRAAETVAWRLRGLGEQLPAHAFLVKPWGPRQILAHLVFWHESYVRQIEAGRAGIGWPCGSTDTSRWSAHSTWPRAATPLCACG